ncbi:MAG: hypothetical protein OXC97_05455 [Candidatus Dadabacteria bacterium]|nr:hypothetical protein [Candidatus Dadabacteria bacterium]
MRKHLIYGFFVLAVVGISGLLYYVISSDAEQPNSHIIQPDLNSALSSPNNALESVQNEEAQVLDEEPLKASPEDRHTEQKTYTQSNKDTENSPETPLRGRRVTLEDGKEIIILESVPDSWKVETEVYFDKEGNAHVKHSK